MVSTFAGCGVLTARQAVGGQRVHQARAIAPVSAPVRMEVTAKQVLEGKVVSNAADKTCVLQVSRKVPHPKYIKRMNKSKKFQVHDPENLAQVGDYIRAEACRPLSKTKRFFLVEVCAKPGCAVDEN